MKQELKCPNCGAIGTLVYQSVQQAAYQYKVLKNGKLSKKFKYVKIGPEEWANITCNQCGAYWTDQDLEDGFELTCNREIVFDNEYEEENINEEN